MDSVETYRLDIKNKTYKRIEGFIQYPEECKIENNNTIDEFFLYDSFFKKIGKAKIFIKPGCLTFILYNNTDEVMISSDYKFYDKYINILMLPTISNYLSDDYKNQRVYITNDSTYQ